MSEYYFDKRKWKRIFIKYGLIFLISFIPIVLFNIYVGPLLGQEWIIVLLDTVLLLVCVAIGNHLANLIFAKKDAELAKKRRDREYIRAQSQAILEASYKKKRQEKLEKKQSAKEAEDVVVIDDTAADNASNIEEKPKTKNTTKRRK